jgi:multidrug efflux pump subunit AcrA (membrane-fusion protein)
LDFLLELLLSALAGMLVVSVIWVTLMQRHRVRARMLGDQLVIARREIEEHELRNIELLSLAHRHLPLGRRPELVREAVQAVDRAMQEWQAELKQLHRRLVVNLHVINQLRKSEEQLSARVVELEQMLMDSSEYELRARFRAVTSERDYFRNQLLELRQMLAPGPNDMAEQLTTMGRHNEVLRQEVRQARRLVQVMQRQIRLLQREGMENAGIALQGLLQHDLPPGAFESLTDVPMDDPEQFADAERQLPPKGSRAAILIGPDGTVPSPQLPLDLPMPISPHPQDDEEESSSLPLL